MGCGQWDAMGAEVVACTNLMTRMLCGGVFARVYVGVHTLLHAHACADEQQLREGKNLLCSNSSGSVFYLEEITLMYQTNKTALLHHLKAIAIT